jgi:Zn-dependent metalloprotease
MYNVVKVITESALKDQLLNDKKEVIENVLPSLAAYEAIMIIKNILDVKEAEKKKELEKLEREGGNTTRLVKNVTIVEEQPEPTTASPTKAATSSPLKKGQSMV